MPRVPTSSVPRQDDESQSPRKQAEPTESETSAEVVASRTEASAQQPEGRAADGSAAPDLGAGSRVSARLAASVRAVAVVARHFEREALEAGLSLPQYRLLLFVRRGPQRAAELAARAAVRRPTLTALVDGLEKEELLARRAVEGDRRGIRLELTSKGLETLDRAEAQLAGFLEEIIGDTDADAILDGLSALARAVERFYASGGGQN